MSERIKADREINAFSEFVAISRSSFSLSTVEKRNPPEPDILCSHLEDGPVAFELVEICDHQIAKFVSTLTEEAAEDGEHFIRTADPSVQVIKKKLRCRYKTKYSIELLCYAKGRVATPANVIVHRIRPYIESFRHDFRRAWLLSRGGVYLIWSAG